MLLVLVAACDYGYMPSLDLSPFTTGELEPHFTDVSGLSAGGLLAPQITPTPDTATTPMPEALAGVLPRAQVNDEPPECRQLRDETISF